MLALRLTLAAVTAIALSNPSSAQDAQQAIGPFLDTVNTIIQNAIEQEKRDQWLKSPEGQAAQIQPGGLTRSQVTIVQQLLIQRGFDVGQPDGVVGPKTMAVVGKLQQEAGVPVTGLPDQRLLEALLNAH